jgi:phosphoribosylanthranilate isomerase
MVFVKICGMRSERDIETCAGAGADAVGFVVETPGSRRNLRNERARELIARARRETRTVLVLSRQRTSPVYEMLGRVSADMVQLHFEPSDDDIQQARAAGVGVIGVVDAPAVGDEMETEVDVIARARKVAPKVDYLLIDTRSPTGLGGTGKPIDTGLARRVVVALESRRVILSGGLDPGNVSSAVSKVKPFGVDVSSGVESGDAKDAEKVRRFIESARMA